MSRKRFAPLINLAYAGVCTIESILRYPFDPQGSSDAALAAFYHLHSGVSPYLAENGLINAGNASANLMWLGVDLALLNRRPSTSITYNLSPLVQGVQVASNSVEALHKKGKK